LSTQSPVTKQIVLPMTSEIGAIRTIAEAKPAKKEPEPPSKGHTEAVHAPAPEAATTMPAAEPKPIAKSEAEMPAPVTVSGCLELNDQTFRLKDTAGADAPKARSWKSGFLTKRAAAIRLVDAVNTLKLPSHVGQRVSATGTLVDGEMRARALQSVAPSCR
jgi:hypothetical protein